MTTSIDPTQPVPSAAPAGMLVIHSAARQWGAGLLVSDDGQRRSYQFEDGELRVFERAWFHLLQEVEADPPVEQRLRQLARDRGGAPVLAHADANLAQLQQWFIAAYSGGFEDPRWERRHRGGQGRGLKRHRAPSIAGARELLALEPLRTLVAQGEFDRLRNRWLDVMAATDLVSTAQLRPAQSLSFDEPASRALIDALHGTEDLEGTFDRLRIALARAGLRGPSWQLLTTAQALLRPELHAYVRPSVVALQAQSLGRKLVLGRAATGRDYRSVLEMYDEIRRALVNGGTPPRDLLDVFDFCCESTTTLRAERSSASSVH